jgi:hypothetical protein
MAVIGNAPFQGLVSGGNIIDASIEGVDLSTSAIAARLGYTPVDPGAAVFSANPTISSGTANAIAYLNGSKVVTTGSALTFDGNTFQTTGGQGILNTVGGNTIRMIATSTATYIGSTTAADIVFQHTANEQARITNGGLSVGPASGAGAINIGSAAGRAQYQYINFGGSVGGTDYAWQIGRNSSTANVGPADGFYIYDLKASATRLVIDGSGNVGIGTIANYTGAKLYVDTKINVNYSGEIAMRYNHIDPAENMGYWKGMTGTAPGTGGTARGLHIFNYDKDSDDGITFWTGRPGSATRLMKILPNGNVGIGTDNPGAKLVVTGSVAVAGGRGSSYALLYPDWMLYNTSSGNNLTFSNYSTELVTITQSGSLLVGTTLNNGYKGIFTATSAGGTTNVLAVHNGSNHSGTGTGARLLFKLSNFEDAIEQNKYASIEAVGTSAYNEDTTLIFRTQRTGNRGNLPEERMRITHGGNVGINTQDPQYRLHVTGNTYINGTFLHSSLAYYPQQSVSLPVNSSGWVKLFTITSPGGCRVRYNGGSQNSEEQGEFSIKGTYVASGTQLTWSRQTYYNSLIELRVTGSNSTPYTVWALVRTTDFAHSFNWQVIEALNSVTLHNTTGETPGTAVATLSYTGYNSTSFNHDVAVTGKLNVKGTAGNADPFIRFDAVSSNSTFNWVSQAMASNLASGNNLVHFIGQDPSTKNSGYIGYKHSSSASDANILTFGLYGVDNVLNISGAGRVGIGVQAPLHTLDVNGALGVNELFGRTQRDTSGGNIDLTEYNANNFVILEVFGSINPNAGGSSYVDPIHMYVYVGRGWNGSSLTSYIYVQHVAPPARDIYPSGGGAGNAIAAVWTNGSVEADTVDAGTTSYYVRLKAYNYNSTFGSQFSVRVIRRA